MQEQFRYTVSPGDPEAIRALVTSSNFFNEEEIAVAGELAEERLAEGETCSYRFVFLEQDGKMAGYSCYGHIPGTATSYDLYWIAVHESCRGERLGVRILEESCRRIREAGGCKVYAETSSRGQYRPTQRFYEKNGFYLEATIKDFYDVGDSKLIYTRELA